MPTLYTQVPTQQLQTPAPLQLGAESFGAIAAQGKFAMVEGLDQLQAGMARLAQKVQQAEEVDQYNQGTLGYAEFTDAEQKKMLKNPDYSRQDFEDAHDAWVDSQLEQTNNRTAQKRLKDWYARQRISTGMEMDIDTHRRKVANTRASTGAMVNASVNTHLESKDKQEWARQDFNTQLNKAVDAGTYSEAEAAQIRKDRAKEIVKRFAQNDATTAQAYMDKKDLAAFGLSKDEIDSMDADDWDELEADVADEVRVENLKIQNDKLEAEAKLEQAKWDTTQAAYGYANQKEPNYNMAIDAIRNSGIPDQEWIHDQTQVFIKAIQDIEDGKVDPFKENANPERAAELGADVNSGDYGGRTPDEMIKVLREEQVKSLAPSFAQSLMNKVNQARQTTHQTPNDPIKQRYDQIKELLKDEDITPLQAHQMTNAMNDVVDTVGRDELLKNPELLNAQWEEAVLGNIKAKPSPFWERVGDAFRFMTGQYPKGYPKPAITTEAVEAMPSGTVFTDPETGQVWKKN